MDIEIQEYLNAVNWSTVTLLAVKFNVTRHTVLLALSEMLATQDVRIYDGEVVHV